MLQFRAIFAVLLTAVAAASPAFAQQEDASAVGGPTSLDSPWRLHFGDDPAFAEPGFDDSYWSLNHIVLRLQITAAGVAHA